MLEFGSIVDFIHTTASLLADRNLPGSYKATRSLLPEAWSQTVLIRQGFQQAARPGVDPTTSDFFGSLRTGQTPDH